MILDVENADKYFLKFISICDLISENRKNNGIRYYCGIMIFSIFLSECAQKGSQRSKQRWIFLQWNLIINTWNKFSNNSVKNRS